MTSGYKITVKAFLPVDPDDMEAMKKALAFIEAFHDKPAEKMFDLLDLTVETHFVSRRKASEPEPEPEPETEASHQIERTQAADDDATGTITEADREPELIERTGATA